VLPGFAGHPTHHIAWFNLPSIVMMYKENLGPIF